MEDEEGKPASRAAGGRGCTLAAIVLLASIVIAFVVPRVGIPLAIVAAAVAGVVLRRVAKKESAVMAAADERRRALGPPVGDIWRRLFETEGLGDLIDDVAPHVRSAARVSTAPVENVKPGRSRVGGAPDLAAGMSWPRRNGVPLAFLAQFDLGEVAQVLGDGPLPAAGHLWFFFDLAKWPSGSDPQDAGGGLVLFDSGAAALEPAAAPDDLAEKHRFPLCAVTMERFEDIPDSSNEPWLDARLDDDARMESYGEISAFLGAGWSTDPHQLLGFARPVQDVMEEECQLVSNGITFGQRKKEAARVKELEAGARDWRLLFQCESDGNAKMMWGDAGSLYFWIREQDLREARFDRTWTLFQCH